MLSFYDFFNRCPITRCAEIIDDYWMQFAASSCRYFNFFCCMNENNKYEVYIKNSEAAFYELAKARQDVIREGNYKALKKLLNVTEYIESNQSLFLDVVVKDEVR